jgi:branched-chain amino acid transport system substrate-binding protein
MFLSRLQPIRGLAVIGLAALCGCRPAPPIKVGFVGGLSERVSELAVDGRNGAQLAIETLNSRNGARYELRVHDDGQVDAQGPAAIDAAADEGDAFAVGPMTSVLAQGMMRRRPGDIWC